MAVVNVLFSILFFCGTMPFPNHECRVQSEYGNRKKKKKSKKNHPLFLLWHRESYVIG